MRLQVQIGIKWEDRKALSCALQDLGDAVPNTPARGVPPLDPVCAGAILAPTEKTCISTQKPLADLGFPIHKRFFYFNLILHPQTHAYAFANRVKGAEPPCGVVGQRPTVLGLSPTVLVLYASAFGGLSSRLRLKQSRTTAPAANAPPHSSIIGKYCLISTERPAKSPGIPGPPGIPFG